MKYWLKLNEIIYKRLTKGPASVDRGSDRKCKMFFCFEYHSDSSFFLSTLGLGTNGQLMIIGFFTRSFVNNTHEDYAYL
jgi:hypothetical protein